MEDRGKKTGSGEANPDEKRRDQGGFQENPAEQGLKTPPAILPGDDSGEWTRGGGSDPNELHKKRPSQTPKR
jgi:hypothetical protein